MNSVIFPIKFGNDRTDATKEILDPIKKLEKRDPRHDFLRLLTDLRGASLLLAAGLKAQVSTVGNGVSLRNSTHLDGLGITGLGLYTDRAFEAGEIITYYYGRITNFPNSRDSVDPEQLSHMRKIEKTKYVIIGNETMPDESSGSVSLKITQQNAQKLMKGLGGAAFINDFKTSKKDPTGYANKKRINCRYDSYNLDLNNDISNTNPFLVITFAVATKNITRDTELLVNYGKTYWKSGRGNKNHQMLATVYPSKFKKSVNNGRILYQNQTTLVSSIDLEPDENYGEAEDDDEYDEEDDEAEDEDIEEDDDDKYNDDNEDSQDGSDGLDSEAVGRESTDEEYVGADESDESDESSDSSE